MIITKDYNTSQEILQDGTGKNKRPWQSKKSRNLALSDSFKRLGDENKSSRTRSCAFTLAFLKNEETGRKTLKSAMFCQVRLCPMCQWRKSLKVFFQLSKVIDEVERRHKDLVPIFLTLTVRNCSADDLSGVLDNIFKGWYQFTKHRKTNRLAKGWFRALEITYNTDENTFHPHIHVLLLVEKKYFKSKDYMHTTDWVQLWRTSAGLDYDPVCDVRKVKTSKGKYKAIAEIAKYTLKDSEILTSDKQLTDKLVDVLSSALHRRRLFAYGGILKKIAKELNADDPDKGDLVHIDDDAVREDIASLIEHYQWHFGVKNYVRSG